MNNRPPWLGFGWLLALLALLGVLFLAVSHDALTRNWILALIALLALARLVP